MENVREIISEPEDEYGHFVMPEKFEAEDEVRWAKVRMDSIRLAQYSDSHCGLPNTFDPAGAYLCAGRKDGASSRCNKVNGKECLILDHKLSDPTHQSCGFWEIANAGDMEIRYCKKGRFEDARAGFGDTDNDLGFGCMRCEYGQEIMSKPDSEGRNRWCKLKGMPVEDNACCEDNEPESSSKSLRKSMFPSMYKE